MRNLCAWLPWRSQKSSIKCRRIVVCLASLGSGTIWPWPNAPRPGVCASKTPIYGDRSSEVNFLNLFGVNHFENRTEVRNRNSSTGKISKQWFRNQLFRSLVPNLFSAMDPFDDLAENCGPILIKPSNTVTYKWSLLERAIIRFALHRSWNFHVTYRVTTWDCFMTIEMSNERNFV